MRTSRFHVLAAAGAIALGLVACGPDNEEVPPPQPTDTPTLPSPANPETVPSGGTTSGPGGAPAVVPEGTQAPAESGAAAGAAGSEPTSGPVAGAERAFVDAAATLGLAEAEAGKLAAEKATNDKVRAFAVQLEKDHTEANNRLTALAQNRGITLPATLEGTSRQSIDELAGLSGAEFDRRFVENFGVQMHEGAIQLFERQTREGQDAEIQAFAQQTLGALRSHLQMARDLAQELQ